ncbi:MAG TPA: glycosyltransferase, partial [Thermoanaerobaculia bacterium]|nr:glycosyltransferase [Thermoanaerobaculia bacterium]
NADGSLQESGSLLFRAYTQFYGFGDDWGKAEYRFRRTVDYSSAVCLLLSRRVFLDLGGFDAAFAPAYFEDVDFCLRLREHGFRTLVEPRSVVTHLRGASGGDSFTRDWWSRNLLVLRRRWERVLDLRPVHVDPNPARTRLLWARDAGADARLLFVSEKAPSSDLADGDPAAFRLLETLSAGWPACRITAMTPGFLKKPSDLEELLGRGVEVAAGIPDAAEWLRERRLHYDVVLFGNDRSASLFDEPLRAFQPQAARLEGATGLSAESLLEALGQAGLAPSCRALEDGRRERRPAERPAASSAPRASLRPSALLILGMHRSGTSALAGCLYHLRVRFGGPLLPANFANEKGYFEHAEVVAIHDELLRRLGTSALDPLPLPDGWEKGPAAQAARERLRALLFRNFGGASLWAVKDPRLCSLLPLWLPLLEEMGVEPRFILMLRSPWQTARSLERRDGLATWESLDLWFRHTTVSEETTRGLRRTVLSYDRLLSEPEPTLARLAEALSVTWPEPLAGARDSVLGFLEPSLRHWDSAALPDGVPPALAQAVTDLHEAFLKLERKDETTVHLEVDARRASCANALDVLRGGPPGRGGPEGEYDVRWISLDAPSAMEAGERASGHVSFTHAGRLPLSGRALSVSYHWLDAEDPSHVVLWEAPRTPLRRVLASGETWSGEFTVQAPERPGRYLLQIDLVKEGVAWFSTKGVAPLTRQVKVT